MALYLEEAGAAGEEAGGVAVAVELAAGDGADLNWRGVLPAPGDPAAAKGKESTIW